MGKKISEKKKNVTDNFYKYTPSLSYVSKDSPKFSFGNSISNERCTNNNKNQSQ